MGRGMTSLHALPGYANTPLAEWQEYPYQALQGGGRPRAVPLSTNKANPLHPSIFQFYFFLKKGKQPKKRLGQRATQEHATSRNGEPCQGRVYMYESD